MTWISSIERSNPGCEELLELVEAFLSWTRTMKAKPSKYRNLAIKRMPLVKVQRKTTKSYVSYESKLKVAGENVIHLSSSYEVPWWRNTCIEANSKFRDLIVLTVTKWTTLETWGSTRTMWLENYLRIHNLLLPRHLCHFVQKYKNKVTQVIKWRHW